MKRGKWSMEGKRWCTAREDLVPGEKSTRCFGPMEMGGGNYDEGNA